MANDLWLTVREFAEEYGLTYAEALAVAKTERLRGHWKGKRRKQYVFNAQACKGAYESGELDEILTSIH